MRFPRNAKIFRGQMDLTPFAGVLFLLVIFVVLGSLLYTPGIPFRLVNDLGQETRLKKTVLITRQGEVVFEGKTNRIEDLEQLGAAFKKLPPQSLVALKEEAGAPKEIARHVREQGKDLPIIIERVEALVDLPVAEGLSGTPNPTIVVAVSFGGQLFFENRLVSEAELKNELLSAVQKSREPLTLLVMADKSVVHEVMMRLSVLASQAGIKDMIQVARPGRS